MAARVSRTLTGRSVAGHSSRADYTHTHTHTHTQHLPGMALRQTHRQVRKQQTRLHILCCMTQSKGVISLSKRSAISPYMDLPSVRTIFHGTRTYRPYVPNFMNTSLDSDVNENINIKTTLTEKTLILQACLLARRETKVKCKRMSV